MTMPAFLCPEDRAARDEQIVALTHAGHSASQIARKLRIAERTVQRVRVRTGVASPTQFIPMSADEIRLAAEMLDDGASYGEVSRTIGRSPRTIAKHLPGRSCWRVGGGAAIQAYHKALKSIVPPLDWKVPV